MADFEFAEDATKLPWVYEEHWSGEKATYAVCGLFAYVKDCDGDFAFWNVRKGKGGPILAEGEPREFFQALHDAEAALRRIVSDRIAELRSTSAPSTAERG